MIYNVVAPEVLKENCLRFFNGDELAVQVWMSKYVLKRNGEYLEATPEDRYHSIAKEFARIDKNYKNHGLTEEDYYYYLVNRIITPAGSGLSGIANPFSLTSLGNCFVVSLDKEDSYGAILKLDEKFVQICKRRGGIGADLSDLRPADTSVTNAAGTSTGAVSFIPRLSNSLREVAQEGRRGAGMLSMSVNYPDIERFIDLKLDPKTATGANLSVRVTDEFMKAVECEGQHVLRYPVDIPRVGTNPQEIRRKVPAKDLWNKMMRAAWKSAEPGILFWDKIISESPADCYKEFQSDSVNPCQPGWAPLLTKEGLTTMDKISIGDQIWSSEGWTTITNKVCTGIKPVYKYQTSKSTFYGTMEHKVLDNGIKVEVKQADGIDLLRGKVIQSSTINPQDIMDGLVFGDGSFHKASNNLVYLCIGAHDQDYFQSEIKDLIKKFRPGLNSQGTAYEVWTNITHEEIPKTYFRKVPERYKSSPDKIAGFLRGVYSANGSVCGNRITLKSASKFVVEDVQLMLNAIGIISYITTNKATDVKFSNGTYTCKQSYDLNITRDRDLFVSTIGFLQQYKLDKIKSKPAKVEPTNCLIQTSNYVADEQVYDITVDNSTHTYWSGGCNVSNCGELPLSANDSCRLLSVNLTSFVDNPFTGNSNFNLEAYLEAAKVATIMMDNIIDLELEKIDLIIAKIESDTESEETKATELNLWRNIKNSCEQGRRAGISAIGHGDMLAMLGLQYATSQSNIFCKELQRRFALQCYTTSIELAEQRGAFPVFNSNLETNNPFLARLFTGHEEVRQQMNKVGRRHIAMLTIPPSGSLSILMDNQTSGIEPAFALVYKRKRKVPAGDPNITFVDATGDCFQEYNVLHPGFQKWMELEGYMWEGESYENLLSIGKLSPYANSTSSEVDPMRRVEMQSMVQQFVDHSISTTFNLPSTVTIEDVSKIYMAAWKSGCKGCTVYREGSRDGILTTGDTKPKSEFEYRDSPKRPRDLPCDIYYPTINGERYVIMVGLYDKKPFEVFALKHSDNYLHHLVSKGILRKQKSRYYNLLSEDNKDVLIEDLGSKFELPEWNAITRLLSWGLRHGGDITFAVEQLNEAEGVVTDVSKVLARTLKKYAKTTRKPGELCPQCQSEMRSEGGCSTCHSCGFSKCS